VRVIVMPSNSCGPWHVPARETGRLGHLFSPGGQRGPYIHFPYALDNGAFACWTKKTNTWHEDKWRVMEPKWRKLIAWANFEDQRPLWAIVPDVPGHSAETLQRWRAYAPFVVQCGIPLALAVQDGMTRADVLALDPKPSVICVGGTDDWKWQTVEDWATWFDRVHVLRCNAPGKLDYLMELGVKSTDGTGWNMGDLKQTSGLLNWAYRNKRPVPDMPAIPLYMFSRSAQRDKQTHLKFEAA
jgi:hypothetical protein